MQKHMKPFSLVSLISISILNNAWSQSNPAEDYVGNYAAKIDTTSRVVIRRENKGLTMEFVGQGRVSISTIGADRFIVSRVRPKPFIKLKNNNPSKTIKLHRIQPLPKL